MEPREPMEPTRPIDYTHRPALDFTARPSKFALDVPPLVGCIRQPPPRPPADPAARQEIGS